MILSLILLNLAGDDCTTDIDCLEKDAGLRSLLVKFSTHGMKRKARRTLEKRWGGDKSLGLPSTAAIHRYLPQFHSIGEVEKRRESKAFIPKPNANLKALMGLRDPLKFSN